MPQKIKSQADHRKDVNWPDQHGRLWLLNLELDTFQPTEIQQAWGALGDPLRTPRKYLKIPDQKGQPVAWGKISVDYAHWTRDVKEATAVWKQWFLAIAKKFYPKGFDTKTIWEDEIVLAEAGPRPFPPIEALARAAKGDQAMLGLAPLSREDRVLLGMENEADIEEAFNEASAPVVNFAEMSYPQFLKEAMGKGRMTMAQAAVAWKAHKENVSL